MNCEDSKREKLFDPAEIKIIKSDIKQKNNIIKLFIRAQLKEHKQIKCQVIKIIKNEILLKTKL